MSEQFITRADKQAADAPFQGELLTLLGEEEADITWKSLIYAVPRGVMSWAIRACTNSLATPDNLARWGKVVDSTCKMEGCNFVATLGHILLNCKKMLD